MKKFQCSNHVTVVLDYSMTLSLSGGICREVEVIDLTQSQSSDESVSFVLDDEDYDDSTHGFDETYVRAILYWFILV